MKNTTKPQSSRKPVLRFSPTAWAKLLLCRDMTDNEVGGFGITETDDLLLVTDFVLVKQKVTPVSVVFEDESVADYFEDQVEAGRRPEQFARVWLHSHPGSSPEPSGIDEETFARVFGGCDWSVMCIVARDGRTFARLRFNAGPGGEIKIPVCVDYSCEFSASDIGLWKRQYKANVTEDKIPAPAEKPRQDTDGHRREVDSLETEYPPGAALLSGEDLISEIDRMHPAEREDFFEELAIRSDFWDEETEVSYG